MITKTIKSPAIIFTIPKNEIEKIDFALCEQPKETIDHYYNRQTNKPTLICNGGFFNMSDGATIFNYKDNGFPISTCPSYKEGMGIKNDSTLEFGLLNDSYKDFISGYPVLIKDGKAVNTFIGSELDYNAKRTVIGYNNENVFIVLVKSPGMNFTTLKTFLLQLGITYAINLDGGGSVRCLYNGKRVTEDTYNRPVDNVVCIYTKPAEKIIYRVQVGAYRVKANAETMQNAIRRLPDTINAGYAKAYVKLIDGLYKVQIGAFSKKENAQKVLNDLKAKGYSAFIAK